MKDGKSRPKNEDLNYARDRADVDLAIAQCPVNVISWMEEDSKSNAKDASNEESKESHTDNEKAGKETGALGIFTGMKNFFSHSKEKALSKGRSGAEFLSKKDITEEVSIFTFRNPGMDFLPGQFITLHLSDGEGEFLRSYSLYTVSDTEFSLCIRLSPNGRGSQFLRKIRKGEVISFSGPLGKFILRDTQSPKIFVATGTGIAPIHLMLSRLPEDIPSLVLYGVRHERDALLMKETNERFPHVIPMVTVSKPGTEWFGFSGRVTSLLPLLSFPKDAEFYICGNPDMVDETSSMLLNQKIPAENIFSEHFTSGV